ncbi:MAG: hypothetical protein NTU69_12365 [Proteobacteria bacterium]|jgi:DNA repair protein RadC|nr:hypothetical protein [Pseudomonadota bacterium]
MVINLRTLKKDNEIRESITKDITDPQAVARVLTAILKTEDKIDQKKEHFWCIGLNTRNIIEYLELVSLGTLSASLVHPREVFRRAISYGVSSIILGHNHPSGTTDPSEEDIKVTRKLVEVGKIVSIEVLDHVIVSQKSFNSLKARGLI